MARNNISLSVDELAKGRRWKVRWREDVIENGERRTVARSKTVTTAGARDSLVSKIRRHLEAGEVFETAARVIAPMSNLEAAGVAWLAWHQAQGRTASTVRQHKSALRRIFDTVRRVRNIGPDAIVLSNVLTVGLFSELLTAWIADDAAATGRKGPIAPCGPRRRAELASRLVGLWKWAASQPAAYPGVPVPPLDDRLLVPVAPPRGSAPLAPTWVEMDAIVARAYSYDANENRRHTSYGDLLAGERMTGLRVDQIASIRRRDVNTSRNALVVATGKSAAEKAEQREVPIPPQLIALWTDRIAAATSPESFLFPASNAAGHMAADTEIIGEMWSAAEDSGEIRKGIYRPRGKRKARPNHAFRAGYMAGLEAFEVEIDGQPVRRIMDKTIDFLVGHHPATVRDRSYSAATWAALEAAVSQVPTMVLTLEAST